MILLISEKMTFHIKKEVLFGNKYVEHIYNPCQQNWCGIWRKVGHGTKSSPTSLEYLCQMCKYDMRQRTQIGNILYFKLQKSESNVYFSKSFH